MGITVHGERYELLHEANADLVPHLTQRFAQASQDQAPAGERAAQIADRSIGITHLEKAS